MMKSVTKRSKKTCRSKTAFSILHSQAFVIAGKKLNTTTVEFEVIFGIAFGDKEIDMKNCSVGDESLGKRKFSNISQST